MFARKDGGVDANPGRAVRREGAMEAGNMCVGRKVAAGSPGHSDKFLVSVRAELNGVGWTLNATDSPWLPPNSF